MLQQRQDLGDVRQLHVGAERGRGEPAESRARAELQDLFPGQPGAGELGPFPGVLLEPLCQDDRRVPDLEENERII